MRRFWRENFLFYSLSTLRLDEINVKILKDCQAPGEEPVFAGPSEETGCATISGGFCDNNIVSLGVSPSFLAR